MLILKFVYLIKKQQKIRENKITLFVRRPVRVALRNVRAGSRSGRPRPAARRAQPPRSIMAPSRPRRRTPPHDACADSRALLRAPHVSMCIFPCPRCTVHCRYALVRFKVIPWPIVVQLHLLGPLSSGLMLFLNSLASNICTYLVKKCSMF